MPNHNSKLKNRNFKIFRSRLTAWFRKSARDLPWRRRRDPYSVLVSEMMLQQTQVSSVIGYFERWMARFPDFKTVAAAPEPEVLHAWQGLGYYSRARNLHRTAQLVVEQHGGNLPVDPEALRALPGIGPYTACAVAAFAFDRPAPVVDANIARVLTRLFNYVKQIDTAAGADWIRQTSTALQPEKGAGVFNEALMELGALVCVPGRPKCPECPVRAFCAAIAPEKLPVKKPRVKTVALAENCAWIFNRNRILLEQQAGIRWRGLWKLPLLAKPAPGRARKIQKPLLKLVYPFTNHRVTLSVFPKPPPRSPAKNQRWIKIDHLDAIAITTPHRRALKRLLASR